MVYHLAFVFPCYYPPALHTPLGFYTSQCMVCCPYLLAYPIHSLLRHIDKAKAYLCIPDHQVAITLLTLYSVIKLQSVRFAYFLTIPYHPTSRHGTRR